MRKGFKSLVKTHPNISIQWHPIKNGNLTPNDFSYGSGIKIWWKCNKGEDHEWEAIIKNRTKGLNCPCCSRQKVVESNCLETTHPKIAKLWHSTENGNLTPKNVGFGCGKKIWWKCDKNESHEWKASINNKISKNLYNCPYCSGRKVCLSNCLKTTHPKIAKQWHPTLNKNLTPFDITFGYSKKVWWRCEKNHEWQSTVNKRTSGNGRGCSLCICSNGEEKIKNILNENKINYIFQKKFINCINIKTKKQLPFDFYLPNYNICIEYDGIQHYEKIEFFGGEKSFKKLKINDQTKTKYCLNNNVKLIRISYVDFENIEKILIKELATF